MQEIDLLRDRYSPFFELDLAKKILYQQSCGNSECYGRGIREIICHLWRTVSAYLVCLCEDPRNIWCPQEKVYQAACSIQKPGQRRHNEIFRAARESRKWLAWRAVMSRTTVLVKNFHYTSQNPLNELYTRWGKCMVIAIYLAHRNIFLYRFYLSRKEYFIAQNFGSVLCLGNFIISYCFFTKFCRCEFLMCRNRSDENMLDIYYISHVDTKIKRKIYIYWEWFLSQGEHRNLCGTVVAKKLSIVVRAGQILLQTFVIIYALGGCAADVQPPQKLTLQMHIFVSKL